MPLRRRLFPVVSACSVLSAVVLLGGCADNFSDASTVSDDSDVSSLASPPSVVSNDPAPDRSASPAVSVDDDVRSVSVDLDVPTSFLTTGAATLGWTGNPSVDAVDGPFGRFGSCSGWRETVSAYSVVVSTGAMASSADALAAVVVWTSDRVNGPGAYEVAVRLERVDGVAWDGSGVATLSDDLDGGTVEASAPDGTRVAGRFACAGSTSPVPVGSSDAVEVFALLRSDGAERVLGLVTTDPASARCGGPDDATLVSATVDPGAGGLGFFELVVGPEPVVWLEAGGRLFELVAPDLVTPVGGDSGVFSGVSSDGVEIDGAYRCA